MSEYWSHIYDCESSENPIFWVLVKPPFQQFLSFLLLFPSGKINAGLLTSVTSANIKPNCPDSGDILSVF